MWRLLEADLQGRLRALAAWSCGILAATLGLVVITEPSVPALYWGVILLTLQPVLVNVTCAGEEAAQRRVHRQVILPLPLSSIGLARALLPAAVQLLGGGLALVLALAGAISGRPVGHWSLPLWLSFGLLCLGQWYTLQRELYLTAPDHRGRASIAGLALLVLLVGITAALLVGVFRAVAPTEGAPLRAVVFQLLGPVTLLLPTAALVAANVALFVRRDPIAE